MWFHSRSCHSLVWGKTFHLWRGSDIPFLGIMCVYICIYIYMYISTCIHITFSIYTWKWTYISKYINFETTMTTIINYIAIFHTIYIYWHKYRYIYTSNMEIYTYIYIYISIYPSLIPTRHRCPAPGRPRIGTRSQPHWTTRWQSISTTAPGDRRSRCSDGDEHCRGWGMWNGSRFSVSLYDFECIFLAILLSGYLATQLPS